MHANPSSRIVRIVAVAALAIAFVRTPALAIPGATIAQFQAWAKANHGLHGLSKQLMNEMTGQPYFTATFRAGSVAGKFYANFGDDNRVSDESVGVDTTSETYDILKHPGVAQAMIATVYGNAVANDFTSAAQVGRWKLYQQTQSTVLYRGKLYGYEASYLAVKLISPAQVDAEAKLLARCATMDCGD